MKTKYTTIFLLVSLCSMGQLDFNNLNVGKYGFGLGIRYHGEFQIGISANDRLFGGPGTSGTDIGLSYYTSFSAPFRENQFDLQASASFGQRTGFGTGVALDVTYLTAPDGDGSSYLLGLGAHVTPGYVSPTASVTALAGVRVPVLCNWENAKPRIGLGLAGGYAPSNLGFAKVSILPQVEYVINDWNPPQKGREEDPPLPPVDARLAVRYHF